MADPMLSVSGLSKTITLHILHGAEVRPLRDVSFDLDAGEFLAIAGPSGAGKSSLLKCLNRTYLATAGTGLHGLTLHQPAALPLPYDPVI